MKKLRYSFLAVFLLQIIIMIKKKKSCSVLSKAVGNILTTKFEDTIFQLRMPCTFNFRMKLKLFKYFIYFFLYFFFKIHYFCNAEQRKFEGDKIILCHMSSSKTAEKGKINLCALGAKCIEPL